MSSSTEISSYLCKRGDSVEYRDDNAQYRDDNAQYRDENNEYALNWA